MATLDGPGLRTVVFMQGCPLRCKFCHNPDSISHYGGTAYSVEELAEKILKNREYWGSKNDDPIKGGVTFSGGDPTLQGFFVAEVAKILQKQGVHVAIDSSLFTTKTIIDALFPYVDMWMVSIKHTNQAKHLDMTGVDNSVILNNIKYVDSKLTNPGSLRIRYLLVPGHTDTEENLTNLGNFVKELQHLEKIEILGYSSIGEFKWETIFGYYPMKGTQEPAQVDLDRAKAKLESFGLRAEY
jgi:pyruvate formate lyase activating enzyme